LVGQSCAIIPGVQNVQTVALKKDHVGIAKFDHMGDEDFRIVAGHLSLMANAAISKIAERWKDYNDPIVDPSHPHGRNGKNLGLG
jgi:hypothetical protein